MLAGFAATRCTTEARSWLFAVAQTVLLPRPAIAFV